MSDVGSAGSSRMAGPETAQSHSCMCKVSIHPCRPGCATQPVTTSQFSSAVQPSFCCGNSRCLLAGLAPPDPRPTGIFEPMRVDYWGECLRHWIVTEGGGMDLDLVRCHVVGDLSGY